MIRKQYGVFGIVVLVVSLAPAYVARTLYAAPVAQVGVQAPGFYRMRLGGFEITALLGGTHTFPIPAVMVRARSDGTPEPLVQARPGEAEALLAEQHLSMPYEGSVNAFLVNTDTRAVSR